MSAQATISEAKTIANGLVEQERGDCGGNVEVAIYRVSTKYGLAESLLKSLRYRAEQLTFIRAHDLEKLREVYERIYEASRQRLLHEIELSKLKAAKLDPDMCGPLEAEIHRLESLYPPERKD